MPADQNIFTTDEEKVEKYHDLALEIKRIHRAISLRTADAFPVAASLPPKNSVCEPERQNDFRDVKPFQPITV